MATSLIRPVAIFCFPANKGPVAESVLYIGWRVCIWLDGLFAAGKWKRTVLEHTIRDPIGAWQYSLGT